MLDETSLRRLAEMGIDVYLPRQAGPAAAWLPAVEVEAAATLSARSSAHDVSADAPVRSATADHAGVLLLAETGAAGPLLRDVQRALRFARIDSGLAASDDEAALGAAAGLIVFGDAQARAVGAVLPAQRQRAIAWVVSAELAALSRDAQAKRALWSELKRLVRALAAPAGAVAGRDVARSPNAGEPVPAQG